MARLWGRGLQRFGVCNTGIEKAQFCSIACEVVGLVTVSVWGPEWRLLYIGQLV